jgi:small subunit ribosomal protein S24e
MSAVPPMKDFAEMLTPKEGRKVNLELGEGYEAYIVRDFYNKLIKRRELDIVLLHIGKPTPSRMKLRIAVSKWAGVDPKRVYIRKVLSEYGVGRTRVEAHIYDTVERALQFEPKYILERNKLPEEEEEG